MNVTSSGNQCSSLNKSRSLLTRTLALILSPLSDVVHRLSCEKIGKVFEDFKRRNKHGINVLLRDALDDIDLVGWISPFTLLIHGSSEDMCTIEQAWVGRMLKPPQDFVIKDFGEISAVNMQQIPQSQFISICETLYQIIASLNENNFSATFECVMNRLSSSFESVVIPPLSAVKKSLNLLVNEKKLYITGGSYFARNTKACSSSIRRATQVNHDSLAVGSSTQEKNHFFKAGKTTTECARLERPRIKHDIKISNVKKVIGSKRKAKKARVAERRKAETAFKSDKRKTNKKMKRCDSQLEKPSSKNLEKNNLIFNEKLDGIPDQDTITHLQAEDLSTIRKKKEKRFSILEKLSRLFKKTSCEELDELISDEYESGSSNRLNEYQINDELTKLVPDNDRRQKSKEQKNRKANVKNERKQNHISTRVVKLNHKLDTTATRTTCEEIINANQYNVSQKKDDMNFKRTRCTRSSPSSASSCSSNEWNWKDLEHDRKIRATKNGPRRFQSHDQNTNSSWSETSSFSNGLHSSEYSSDTCCESERTPLHYSPAINDKSTEPRDAGDVLNFCSTQAICGDLELSTPSRNSVAKEKSLSPPVANVEHITSTRTPTMTLNERQLATEDKNISELQTKNLYQLIGIL